MSSNGHGKLVWLSESFLGKTFMDLQQEVVLEIGNDRYTRQQMVHTLGVGNLAAARRLTNTIKSELGGHVANIKDLARTLSFDDFLRIEGVGVTIAYVLLSAMEDQGVNVAKWVGEIDVTLHSEQLRARAEASSKKERKRGRGKAAEKRIAKRRDPGIRPSTETTA